MKAHVVATLVLSVATLVAAAQSWLVVALILASLTVVSWAVLTIRSHRRWPQRGNTGAPVVVSLDPNPYGRLPVVFVSAHGMGS
jgi:hypothetical protein